MPVLSVWVKACPAHLANTSTFLSEVTMGSTVQVILKVLKVA